MKKLLLFLALAACLLAPDSRAQGPIPGYPFSWPQTTDGTSDVNCPTSTPGKCTTLRLNGQVLPSFTNGALTWNSGSSTLAWVPSLTLGSVTGSGLWHSTSSSLDSAALNGTADQLVGENHAGTDTTFFTPSGDLALSSGAFTFNTVNANVGTFGDSSHSLTLTLNAKGLVTAASASTIAAPLASATGTLAIGQLQPGTAAQLLVTNSGATAPVWVTASGDVTVAATGVHTLASVVTAGTVGSGSAIPVITYDAKGRITSATTAAIASGGLPTIALTGDTTGTGSGGTVPTTTTKLQSFSGPLTAPENGSWSQTAWYVDAQSAVAACSDSNAGTSSAVPLCTFAEIARRWGTLSPNLASATTITVESNAGSTDIFAPTPLSQNLTIVGVTGSGQQTSSGTISGFVARNQSTGQLTGLSKLTGMAVGNLIVNTTHASYAWVYAISGSNVTVSQPLIAANPWTEVNSWANGDSITTYSLLTTKIPTVGTGVTLQTVNDTSSVVNVAPGTSPALDRSFVTGGVMFTPTGGALVDSTITTNVYYGSAVSNISDTVNTNSFFFTNLTLYGGVVNQLGGRFNLYFDIILANNGGSRRHAWTGGVTEGVYVDTQQLHVTDNVVGVYAPIWGSGLVQLTALGSMVIQGTASSLLLTSGSIILTPAACATTITGIACGTIPLTPANIDLAAGSGGYNGYAFALGGGYISTSAGVLTSFAAGVSSTYISGTGIAHVTSGTLDTTASIGTADQILDTNHAATATEWFTLGGDATFANHNLTLATVNSNVGTFGDSSHSLTLTLNAKGLVTAASAPTIAAPLGSATGTLAVGQLAPGTAAQLLVTNSGATAPAWVTESGDVTLAASGVQTLATVNSNTGTCGDSTHVCQVTLNAKGLATAAAAVAIASGGLPTITLTGDTTGSGSGGTVPTTTGKINGASVPVAGALATGNTLGVTGSSTLAYSALNLAGGAGYVTGSLPAANQASQTMTGDVGGTTAANVVNKVSGASAISISQPAFTWTAGAGAVDLSQAAATSGAGSNFTFCDAQSATTSGASGSCIANVKAPASGTTEGYLGFNRAGSTLFKLQGLVGAPTGDWAIYGGGLTAGTSNFSIASDTSGTNLILNAATAGYQYVNNTPVTAIKSGSAQFAQPLQGGDGTIIAATPFALGRLGTNVSISTTNVVLTAAQYELPVIPLSGTMTGNRSLTFPNVNGHYELDTNNISLNGFQLALIAGGGSQSLSANPLGVLCPLITVDTAPNEVAASCVNYQPSWHIVTYCSSGCTGTTGATYTQQTNMMTVTACGGGAGGGAGSVALVGPSFPGGYGGGGGGGSPIQTIQVPGGGVGTSIAVTVGSGGAGGTGGSYGSEGGQTTLSQASVPIAIWPGAAGGSTPFVDYVNGLIAFALGGNPTTSTGGTVTGSPVYTEFLLPTAPGQGGTGGGQALVPIYGAGSGGLLTKSTIQYTGANGNDVVTNTNFGFGGTGASNAAGYGGGGGGGGGRGNGAAGGAGASAAGGNGSNGSSAAANSCAGGGGGGGAGFTNSGGNMGGIGGAGGSGWMQIAEYY